MNVPLSLPDITEAEIDAVAEVLRSGRLSLGSKLEEFEAGMAEYIGVPHAIAVSSGTAGLHLCVRALGLAEGDEVLVPSFTFIAAANAIRYERATPVFVDIDPVTLNVDPQRLEESISPRTRAIIAVHTFGVPAEMDAILAIARRHHLYVIEDACEAIGAEYDGRRVGSFGDAAVFGFYPNKQITTGEGGMVVTAHPELASQIRALRNQGRYESSDWFQHEELGYNYRLSEVQCALGIVQMRRIGEILKMREAAARGYGRRLRSLTAGLLLPSLALPRRRISWFVYVVRLAGPASAECRDAVLARLAERGIGCGRYFAPIHRQRSYILCKTAPLAVTDEEAQRTLALPFFNCITDAQIDYVCEALEEALQRR
jgi:perosamine synthetase